MSRILAALILSSAPFVAMAQGPHLISKEGRACLSYLEKGGGNVPSLLAYKSKEKRRNVRKLAKLVSATYKVVLEPRSVAQSELIEFVHKLKKKYDKKLSVRSFAKRLVGFNERGLLCPKEIFDKQAHYPQLQIGQFSKFIGPSKEPFIIGLSKWPLWKSLVLSKNSFHSLSQFQNRAAQNKLAEKVRKKKNRRERHDEVILPSFNGRESLDFLIRGGGISRKQLALAGLGTSLIGLGVLAGSILTAPTIVIPIYLSSLYSTSAGLGLKSTVEKSKKYREMKKMGRLVEEAYGYTQRKPKLKLLTKYYSKYTSYYPHTKISLKRFVHHLIKANEGMRLCPDAKMSGVFLKNQPKIYNKLTYLSCFEMVLLILKEVDPLTVESTQRHTVQST